VIAETAATRHLRIAAIATGFGSIVFGLLAVGDIQRDSPHLHPWFATGSVALFCGLPVLLVPLGWWGSVIALRWVARVHTIAALAIVALWTPAMLDGPLPDGSAPWVLNTLGVVAGTAVVGWRSRIVWPYLVTVAFAGSVLRYVGLNGHDWVIPLEDGLSILEVSVVLAALLTVTISAGRSQDIALAAAVNDARAAADADSRARQRARFGSLVHDDVITTLLAAAQATEHDEAISRSAARAIAHLDSFIAAPSDGMPLDADLLEVEVRAAVTDVVDGVEFSGSFSEWNVGHGNAPGRVALAMTGAIGEAARNSVRHAGPGQIHRKVVFRSTSDRLSAELIDDGQGFEPDRVGSDRLGIRSSIVANMAAVGGKADVISTPGAGARVVISWPWS
jgi:signal transduction histidine kinase